MAIVRNTLPIVAARNLSVLLRPLRKGKQEFEISGILPARLSSSPGGPSSWALSLASSYEPLSSVPWRIIKWEACSTWCLTTYMVYHRLFWLPYKFHHSMS